MLYARRPRVGSVFGPLTVLRSDAGNSGLADCVCACGGARTISVRQLWRGQSLQCRQCTKALMREQRRNTTSCIQDRILRAVWGKRYQHMLRRCYDPRCEAFPNYGGRGIGVCDAWRQDREAFFAYVQTLPRWDERGLDLDREKNERGYEPGNIRLVTRRVNANNKRSNRRVQYRGREFTLAEFWRQHCPKWRGQNAVAYHLDQGRSTEWIVAKHDEGRRGVRSPELRAE